jgi:hypothetical protein
VIESIYLHNNETAKYFINIKQLETLLINYLVINYLIIKLNNKQLKTYNCIYICLQHRYNNPHN